MFRLLRQLDLAPNESQRVMALAINVLLGRLNTLLRLATENGLLNICARNGPDKRARFT
ncbi:MAG: sulfate adenylyltransferase [Octadecabacter sp.]|jgi:sulfate adenylyltransferase